MQSDHRKADTKIKIELGGLVIKAGLGGDGRALILGILLEGVRLAADPATRTRMTEAGHAVLVGVAPAVPERGSQ
jgi:hypothetical protein